MVRLAVNELQEPSSLGPTPLRLQASSRFQLLYLSAGNLSSDPHSKPTKTFPALFLLESFYVSGLPSIRNSPATDSQGAWTATSAPLTASQVSCLIPELLMYLE